MNPCLCFVVLQEFGALQTLLLKYNRGLEQRALRRTWQDAEPNTAELRVYSIAAGSPLLN